MKTKNIIMACSMLMLLPAISSCQQIENKRNEDAFERCYELSYPAMSIGNDWLEYAKDIRPANITKMESKPFDYKWSYTLECELTPMPGQYIDMGAEYHFVTVANSRDGSVCFCQTWQSGKLILTWAK